MFIEKTKEISKLRASLKQALSGNGNIVLIEGEAGLGKTTLVSHFLDEASNNVDNLIVAVGNCTAISGEGDAFHPFRQILRQLVAPENQQNSRFLEFVASLAPAWLGAIPGIGALIAAIVETGVKAKEVYAQKPRAGSQQEMFSQFLDVIQQISKKNPLVLFLDNLQWADQSSISLLFHVAKNISALRLVAICAFRPPEIRTRSDIELSSFREVIYELRSLPASTFIAVERLSEGQTRKLISLELPNNRFTSKFAQMVHRRSGGNPLFVVSLVETLKMQHTTSEDLEKYLQGFTEDLDIPDRIESVIRNRLDELTADLRDLCDLAAVNGIEFYYEILAEVLKREFRQSNSHIGKQFRILEKDYGLITEKGEQTLSHSQTLFIYAFTHGLLQEVLYYDLPAPMRQQYHILLGNILEKMFPNSEDFALPLAVHFLRGKKFNKAASYFYLAAANNRWTLLATTEAVYNLEQAIEALESIPENEQNILLLADCYQMMAHIRGTTIGQHDVGIALYKKASDCRTGLANQQEYMADCFHMMGVCYSESERWEQAMDSYNNALMLMQELEGLEYTSDYRRIPPLGNEPGLLQERKGNILRDIGIAYYRQGKIEKAINYFEQSLQLLENGSDKVVLSDTFRCLGYAYLEKNEFGTSQIFFRKALSIVDHGETYVHLKRAIIYKGLADLAFRENNSVDGFSYAKQAIELGKENRSYYFLTEFLLFAAEKYLERRHFSEAFQSYAEALLYSSASSSRVYDKTLNIILGKVKELHESGRLRLAEDFCDLLLKYAETSKLAQRKPDSADIWRELKTHTFGKNPNIKV
ncbi:MAG: AAA family ATPase [Chloroflexi bacterium]|nr:AAA family ATPase [Chloroflexota bacterium]